ncbi:MAG: pirin family protein [Pseudohongiellaceae bacterium]
MQVISNVASHWVGDGFPVRSLFSYNHEYAELLSPFLLVDYAGPQYFPPTSARRGVGEHPHRGFETVTIVYQGEVSHRDTAGNGGTIGPGDVQWMSASSGILHEEFHSGRFADEGGDLQMIQLWVNLPAKDKMGKPAYQAITNESIPVVGLPGRAGTVRVIAGNYEGISGPARTHTAMHVWDITMGIDQSATLTLPESWGAGVIVLEGTVQINDDSIVRGGEMALLDSTGEEFKIAANNESKILLISGEPINERVVGQGPFVMNTADEIRKAFLDFQTGKFGEI